MPIKKRLFLNKVKKGKYISEVFTINASDKIFKYTPEEGNTSNNTMLKWDLRENTLRTKPH